MSFVSAECLDNIIGLSQNDCECFERPDYASESLSGLYLDKLEGIDLNMANAGANCEHGSLWEILDSSRDSGIKQFRTYLQLGLTKEYKKKNKTFSGAIGESNFRNNLTLTQTYAELSVYTNNIRGGYMKVKRIGTMFSQTGNFDIDLYDDIEDASLETINVLAEAGKLKWNTLTTPLYLPLANETGQSIRYDFIYTTALASGSPKDAKTHCGCHGKHYYDEHNPKFNNTSSQQWGNYVMVAGGELSSVSTTTDRDNASHNSLRLNGIILDVEFSCDVSDLICQQVSDFDNGDLSLAIATCIRYISGVFLIDTILASGSNISFYTMTDRERLMGKKNTYTKEYQNLLQEIILQFDISLNDCLVCDNSRGPVKRGILA